MTSLETDECSSAYTQAKIVKGRNRSCRLYLILNAGKPNNYITTDVAIVNLSYTFEKDESITFDRVNNDSII